MAPPNIWDKAAGRPDGGAGDMFLKVKGAKHGLIKGESQDDSHKGEIEVLSWSWGMQAPYDLHTGQSSGKATIKQLMIVKKVDSASTALMSALRTNEKIKEAVLTLRKAGKNPLEYLKITIQEGFVRSLDIGAGDSSCGSNVFENVGFTFNKISVEYVGQGNDGQPTGGMVYSDQFSV